MIFDKLTPRENKVAVLLLEGKTNKEMANALNITESTAKFHMRNIIEKYGDGEFQPTFYIRMSVRNALAKLAGTLIENEEII
jgi:FixJ family two-component response regulator